MAAERWNCTRQVGRTDLKASKFVSGVQSIYRAPQRPGPRTGTGTKDRDQGPGPRTGALIKRRFMMLRQNEKRP
ncbi:hypothetical protein EYF80_051937 [Liparis tanakae]|uniref:Uncharacterized protein n=1 Tax=Liparis tanakae TaxID=230148 RepID=A0A4Z2F9P5_9TELE|nr:hypothetical protein EYF80_051937 [Liparis tanakae]